MGKRLTASKQLQRDQEMALEHARGFRLERIATNHRVGERTVRRALARQRRSAADICGHDPIEELRGHRLRLEAAVSELAELRRPGTRPSARIEAIRLQVDVLKEMQEIDVALGLLPAPGWDTPGARDAIARRFKGWLRRELTRQDWEDDPIQAIENLVDQWLVHARSEDRKA